MRTFTAEGLDNGLLLLRFLAEKGLAAGFCHYIDIYDAKGTLLGRR